MRGHHGGGGSLMEGKWIRPKQHPPHQKPPVRSALTWEAGTWTGPGWGDPEMFPARTVASSAIAFEDGAR